MMRHAAVLLLSSAFACPGGGAKKDSCLALATRIGDSPEPAAAISTPDPSAVRVMADLDAVDFSRPPVETAAQGRSMLVAMSPERLSPDDRKAFREGKRVQTPWGEFHVQMLPVEEYEMPDEAVPAVDPAVANREWSLELVNHAGALEALAEQRSRQGRPSLAEAPPGSGVVIGHPDTGYTFHRGLGRFPFGPPHEVPETRLRPVDGYGFSDCSCSAYDLDLAGISGIRNPRHGTHAASVIVGLGRHTDPDRVEVRGVAPGAELMPLRTAAGVVLGEARGFQLAMAVRHASAPGPPDPAQGVERWYDACLRHAEVGRRGGVHGSLTARQVQVLSISLGGPRFLLRRSLPLLQKAIRLAETQGIIVVAAPGQAAPPGPTQALVKILHGSGVVYPAAFDGVVAVAAGSINGLPWNRTFHGPEVLLTGPGEAVWNAAEDENGRDTIVAGNGTSYSAAIVAGVAALWLDYHGRAALVERFGLAGVPSAFRHVLAHHGFNTPRELCALAEAQHLPYSQLPCSNANVPWNAGEFGVGMLDARKVLEAPLPSRQELCAFVRDGTGPSHRWRRTAEDAALICPGS